MFAKCLAKKEGAENEDGIIVPKGTDQDKEDGEDDDQIRENAGGDQLGEGESPTAEDGSGQGADGGHFRSESEVHE